MSLYVEMQELREEIDSLKEEIQKLKIEKTNDSMDFVPEEGLNYYTINSKGGIQEDIWSNYSLDKDRHKFHNTYIKRQKTKDNLQWYADNILKVQNRMMQLHELLCPDSRPVWGQGFSDNYMLFLDATIKKWKYIGYRESNFFTVPFTEEAAAKACNILNKEKFMIGEES